MRKKNLRVGLKVGLLVVGLLAAIAPPATAQFADPLSLAASGVLIPFFGAGSNITFLEVALPVGPRPEKIAPGPPPGGFADLHVILYSATCVRGNSFPAPDTVNGTTIYAVTGGDGLAAIADDFGNGIDLKPLVNPIHTRAYWANAANTQFRVLEPILVDSFDPIGGTTWTPLRSGATFFAPKEGAFVTTLYLICPGAAIADAFPASRFPAVTTTTQVSARVYVSNPGAANHEVFVNDYRTPCTCLTTLPINPLSPAYALTDTYTELEGSSPVNGAFTGYKGLKFPAGGAAVDFFGRLSNANRQHLQGINPSVPPVTR